MQILSRPLKDQANPVSLPFPSLPPSFLPQKQTFKAEPASANSQQSFFPGFPFLLSTENPRDRDRECAGGRVKEAEGRAEGREVSLFSTENKPSSENPSMQSSLELKGDQSSPCLHPCTSPHFRNRKVHRRVEARTPVLPLLDLAVKHSLTSARPGFYARFTNQSFIKFHNRSPNYLSRKSKNLMRYFPPSLLFL